MDYADMSVEQLTILITALAARENNWNPRLTPNADIMFDRALNEVMLRAINGEPVAMKFIRGSIVHMAKNDD